MSRYDYIIAGAGAAGLSLLIRMIDSGKFQNNKILVIDRAPKTINDRTWCYWEQGDGFFEDIVYHKWEKLFFYSNTFSSPLKINPYRYKMIRGIDFYNWCFEKIGQQINIDIRFGDCRFQNDSNGKLKIYIDDDEILVNDAVVFNSISNNKESKKNTVDLLQHFKGWIIETEDAVFDTDAATLMDFRVSQNLGTTFVYVMPLTSNKALVEYTLFTEAILRKEQYEIALKDYILNFLKISNYNIIEEEFGIIPMTNAQFPFYKNGMYHIGKTGGQTKASTGYTFQFIQKQSQQIINCLIANKPLQQLNGIKSRFNFYDGVLLQLLREKKLGDGAIFTRLFQKNKASKIFKFLDNETSVMEEARLMVSLQIPPFFKAALNQLF